MGLLVKAPSVSIRRRPINQDDDGFETNQSRCRRTVDTSFLDRNTIDFLLCEVRSRQQESPVVEKDCSRNKKRWKRKEKRRRRAKKKKKSRGRRYEVISEDNNDSGRTAPLGELSDSESESDTIKFPENRPPQNSGIVIMAEAFECMTRADYHSDENNESDGTSEESASSCSKSNEGENDDGRNILDQSSSGGLSMFSKSSSFSKSSFSSSSSRFSRMLGKLGRNRWTSFGSRSGSDGVNEKKVDEKCNEDNAECSQRISFSSSTDSIFDFGDDDDDEGEIQGVSTDMVQDKLDPIIELGLIVQDDELDPIFVSGLDVDSFDEVSYLEFRTKNVKNSRSLIDERDESDDVRSEDGESGNDDEERDDKVGECKDIGEVKRKKFPSIKPGPPWVQKNHDKRNDLAWVHGTFQKRGRERKRRKPFVTKHEDSLIADICDPWGCGEVLFL